MDGGWALILSAAVTAVGGILVTLISLFRRESRTDHDIVLSNLRIMNQGIGRVETKIDKVDSRLTNHLISHAIEGLDNERRVNKNRTEGNTEIS